MNKEKQQITKELSDILMDHYQMGADDCCKSLKTTFQQVQKFGVESLNTDQIIDYISAAQEGVVRNISTLKIGCNKQNKAEGVPILGENEMQKVDENKDSQDMLNDPPANGLWGKFAAEKWDHEYARNVLLHFIDQKGLTEEADAWVDKNWPEDKS